VSIDQEPGMHPLAAKRHQRCLAHFSETHGLPSFSNSVRRDHTTTRYAYTRDPSRLRQAATCSPRRYHPSPGAAIGADPDGRLIVFPVIVAAAGVSPSSTPLRTR
jgi:hypothetical protein